MTVIYRATTVINFGHGDLVMAGAFSFICWSSLPVRLSCFPRRLAVVLLFAFGVAVYKGLIRPIMAGPHLALAMMAVAVGYALRGLARLVWGREVLPFPKVLPQGTFMVGPVILAPSDLIVTGAVVATVAILATRLLRDAARQDGAGRIPIRAGRSTGRYQCLCLPEHDVGHRRGHGRAGRHPDRTRHAPLSRSRRRHAHPRFRCHDAWRLWIIPGRGRRRHFAGLERIACRGLYLLQAYRHHGLSHHHRRPAYPPSGLFGRQTIVRV